MSDWIATLTPQGFRATLAATPGPPGPPGPQGPAGPPGGLTTQADMSATRDPDMSYQNNGATSRLVLTSWQLNGKGTMIALSDENDPPVTQIAVIDEPSGGTGVTAPLTFVVLPGNYYMCSITAGTPVLKSWIEYQ